MSSYRILAYSKIAGTFKCFLEGNFIPAFTVQESDINRYFSVVRILSSSLESSKYSSLNWDHMGYLENEKLRSWMKHIGYHSFTIGNTIYVPLPNIELNGDIPQEFLNPEIMLERYNFAISNNFLDKDFSFSTVSYNPVAFHENPDFLLFHMQDYLPWPGISECLYGGFFIKGTEKWNHYFIPQNNLPPLGNLSNLKGILITGAKYCSYDTTLPWVEPLFDLLRNIHEHYPHVKFIGICLGHQILARAFGGETGRNPSNKFIYHLEEFSALEEFEGLPNKLKVSESHGDCVLEISPQSRIIYTSPSTHAEMLKYGNWAVSVQGHPEFTSMLMKNFHSKFCHRRLPYENMQEILNSYTYERTDSELIIEAFNRFIRRD